MPREVFVAGQVLTAAELNVVSDQSVMVFADSSARGTAIPSPSEGMVTYLEDTNDVEVYNGSAFTAVGQGSILQVVSTTKTTVFSTTSTSMVDVTGLSASITPRSTSSKIFVIASLVAGNSSSTGTVQFNLVRDSTDIAKSTGSSVENSTLEMFTNSTGSGDSNSITFLDSPATTSSTTYKIQAAIPFGGTGYVGRIAANDQGSSATITLMEVAG